MLIVATRYARILRVGVSCGADDNDEQHDDDEYGDHGVSFVSPPHRTRRRGSGGLTERNETVLTSDVESLPEF